MKNVLFPARLLSGWLLAAALIISLAVMGFQCASAEMTSAKMSMQRSNWADAERHLEQEVAKNPTNAEAWYLLGRVRLEQKNYRGMNEAYSRSLSAGNQFEKNITADRLSVWGTLFNNGVESYLKGKNAQGDSVSILLNKSVDYFRTALAINSDSAATYMNLGLAYLGLNNFDEAIRNFETSLQKGKDPALAASVGNMHLERGRKFQKEAQSVSGTKKDSLQNLSKSSFTKAILMLEQGQQWAPENQIILGSLLDAYLATGRTDEAMNKFKLAVDKTPNNKLYRYNYGVLLLKAGNHQAAIDQFKAAVVVDPKFEDALYNLGVTYLQWGAKLKSEAEATAKSSKNKQVSKVYEQFKEGKGYLEQLRDLKPNDPDVWEALGQAYANLNMQKQASEAFAKADNLRKAK